VLVRAADDLNAIAERARRDPDPVDEARARLDALFRELETLIGVVLTVDASAVALGAGGEDLLAATRDLNSTARTIETGGRELRRTGEVLDAHTQELIWILRAALPRLLDGLDTVEDLEASVETVAETVEPLQDVAKGVGRVTDRLRR